MAKIKNPVLTGFHPDPCIVRVDDDYYIAVSTFEWFPGVQIHHSKDLVNWQLRTNVLTRKSQLDMIGNADSGGIWAPALSYCDGTFYLIYTDVKNRLGAFRDAHNYMVTAPSIDGPWSEPIYLNSSGFDPSLFHDADGRKWLLNMQWDFRKGKNRHSGIVIQEYSESEKKLVGPITNIFLGTELVKTEAPHIFIKNGYYYLVTAEGGTGYDHAVTIARSKNILGPYEVDPTNPILTANKHDLTTLQKAGHASFVETQDGEWYFVHLCGRPVADQQCILGRETAIQKCYWTEDDWIRVENGPFPSWEVDAPNLPEHPFASPVANETFDVEELPLYWNALRRDFNENWISLKERPGYLRLKGGESPSSKHFQSMLCRRLEHFNVELSTTVEFEPERFQQMAGLILYYDTDDYVYLRITHHEELGKCIGIICSKLGEYDELLDQDLALPNNTAVTLKATINENFVQFYYQTDDNELVPVGSTIDFSHLSDDAKAQAYLRFTGTFVGICAQDLSGQALPADFHQFTYEVK